MGDIYDFIRNLILIFIYYIIREGFKKLLFVKGNIVLVFCIIYISLIFIFFIIFYKLVIYNSVFWLIYIWLEEEWIFELSWVNESFYFVKLEFLWVFVGYLNWKDMEEVGLGMGMV